MRTLSLTWMLFLLIGCGPLAEPRSQTSFSSGEHVILGDKGYRAACTESPQLCGMPLVRADGRMSFTYGELVAFSGDFYEKPEDLYFEKVEPFFKWHRNNVGAVKDKFADEVETIENFLHGHDEKNYPDFNLAYAWNYPDYLAAALNNAPHFGFYNMLAYVEYHSRALTLAAQGSLNEALFMNAFADHFLTDGFAAGHVRTPRVQILEWATALGVNERGAGALAKIVHDRDGEIRLSGEHGLQVSNAAGDHWLTRCDSQLFWQNSWEDPSIRLPIQAVEASLKEVFAVYESGTIPRGVFAATLLVPFPAPAERALTQVFPRDISENQIDAIMKQAGFLAQIRALSGFSRVELKQLIQDLPDVMQTFRNDVAAELAEKPILTERLPLAYREAYREIR